MKIVVLTLIMLLMAGFAALPIYFLWVLPRRRSQGWLESAAKLALQVEPPPSPHHPVFLGRMYGVRDGFEVHCQVRSVGHGESRTFYTKVMVELPRPLEAHLSVRPVGRLGRMWNTVSGESDIQLGDPIIDPAYSIEGLDDRVMLLLAQSEVAEALRQHARAPLGLRLSDHRVGFEGRGLHLDPSTLGSAIAHGIDIANRLLRAQVEAQRSPRWQAMAFS